MPSVWPKPSIARHRVRLLLALALTFAARAQADDDTTHFGFNYSGEVFANLHGGMQTGSVYTGLFQGLLDWHAGAWAAHGDIYFPHGDSLTQRYVGDFSVASNIDGVHQLRLHELWAQRQLGPVSLRLGLLAADTEFWGSDTANLFVSSAFGAPSVVSGNLPKPPIFPQGVLGARVAFEVDAHDTLRIAVLDGDGGDPTSENRHGLHVDLGQGALLVVEDQHRFGNPAAPAGSARLGAFLHTGAFSNTGGATVHGDLGLLGAIDYALSDRLEVFARAGIADRDRSTVPWSVETGATLSSVFAPRNTLGLAIAYVDLNEQMRTPDYPLGRRREIIVEGSLDVPVNEAVALQPDVQYIIDPGGTASARNALVLGLRVNVALGR